MELCAKFVVLMVIMEQVGLFNLNKYSNMVLKTVNVLPLRSMKSHQVLYE